MRLLIQHRHVQNEISGVLTYIQLITPPLQAAGTDVREISTRTSIRAWFQAILWADVIHMNSNDLPFTLLGKLLGKPIVLKYHYPVYQSTHFTYEPMAFGQRLKAELRYTWPEPHLPLKWKLYTLITWLRLAIRLLTGFLVDRRVACSQFLATSCDFPLPIQTLHNPIALPTHLAPKTVERLGQPLTFVFVGQVRRDKGVDVLLRAAQHLRAQGYDFRLTIIGQGPGMEPCQTLATDLAIADITQFKGQLAHDQALDEIRGAIALVTPSRWQEPACYTMQEAASQQTCPIGSRVGGIPEVASPYGLLFDNEDVEGLARQMQMCLDQPEQALERGRQAYHYMAEHFTPSQAAADLLRLCETMLNPQAASDCYKAEC